MGKIPTESVETNDSLFWLVKEKIHLIVPFGMHYTKGKDMQATLVVKNLSKIYTCNPAGTQISNGFIACYHDQIVAAGPGDGSKYIDPELTRVIDGTGCIAVPAFIEPRYTNRFEMEYQLREDLTRRFYNGILTFVTDDRHLCRTDLLWKVVYRKEAADQPVYSLKENALEADSLLSTMHSQWKITSFQPLLLEAAHGLKADSADLLMQITRIPAQRLHLEKYGQIKKGMNASFLLIYGNSFDDYIFTVGSNPIERIVHKGIPVWPAVIRC